MLRVECPNCARTFRVSPEWAGKTARCKHCRARIVIPAAALAARPDTATFSTDLANGAPETTTELSVVVDTGGIPSVTDTIVSRDAPLLALPESIEPVRLARGYMLALSVVAGLLVLLPILYISLALLIAYGVFWHFAHGQWLFDVLGGSRVHGKGAVLVLVAWAAPGVIGTILVLFMFKPLFRRRRWHDKPFTLSRSDEPLLYQFVDRLCDCVRAPRPVRIDLIGDVNASASFASRSSLLTNRLVLTIGLPLVAGVSLRNFAGVLAHEFGHFSQFWAMRLTYIIETVNDWFRRVVEERDPWDERLEAWSQQVDIRVGWVLYVARFFVWVVRRILSGFRTAGLFFSRRLAREMEFHADAYETRIAGSAAFAETSERMAILNLASMAAERGATQFLREGRAIDDFARFTVYQASELKPEQLKPLLDAVRNAPAPWESTHPSDAERIARAEAIHTPGAFQLDAAATMLFRDFTALSREFTRRGYRKGDGQQVALDDLTKVDDLIVEQQKRRARFESARCFVLQADPALARFINTEWKLETELSSEALWDRVRTARETLQRERPEYLAATEQSEKLWDLYTQLQLARMTLAAGEKIKPGALPWKITQMVEIDAHMKDVSDQEDRAEAQRAAFDAAFVDRLRCDLQLASQIVSGDERAVLAEIDKLWQALEWMAPVTRAVLELQLRLAQLEALFARLAANSRSEALSKLIELIRKNLLEEFERVWGYVANAQYPFELPHPAEHLAHALISHLTDGENPIALHGDVEQFCTGYWSLWRRTLGRLTEIAHQVEGTGGLPPLSV